MSMRPILFIGVGGSGGATISHIHRNLVNACRRAGWPGHRIPAGWQFLHIDVPAQPDVEAMSGIYEIPSTDYLPLTDRNSSWDRLNLAMENRVANSATASPLEKYLAWEAWRPKGVSCDITEGAGQMRAVGRGCLMPRLDSVRNAISSRMAILNGAASGEDLDDFQRRLGVDVKGGRPAPMVMLFGSVCGGSGSGMVLDVSDVAYSCGAQHVMAALYAPDVFPDDIDTVAPNAFMAFSSITHAGHIRDVSDAQVSRQVLYRAAGINTASVKMMPDLLYLVGASNGVIDFAGNGSTEVAKTMTGIVGRAMAELAAEEELLTELFAVYSNIQVRMVQHPDNLLLSDPTANEFQEYGRLGSIGFGSISVGGEHFGRYAEDRLMRLVCTRLLDQHLTFWQPGDSSDPSVMRQKQVDARRESFIYDSNIDEVDSANFVTDRLLGCTESGSGASLVSQELDGLEQRLTQALQERSDGREIKGDEARADIDAILRAVCVPQGRQFLEGEVSRVLAGAAVEARSFGTSIQESFRDLVMRYMAECGLPVTLDLVEALIARTEHSIRSLHDDTAALGNEAEAAYSRVLAPGVGERRRFRVDVPSDDMIRIVSDAVSTVEATIHAEVHRMAAGLLEDLSENLLRPWHIALSDVLGELEHSVRPVRGHKYLDMWPRDTAVPHYLRPSPTEYLLDDVDDFPALFDTLVADSAGVVEDTPGQSGAGLGRRARGTIADAVQQIIRGERLRTPAPDEQPLPKAFQYQQDWVIGHADVSAAGTTPRRAHITSSFALGDIRGRVQAWLYDQQKAVGSAINLSLEEYVTQPSAREQSVLERQQRLVTALGSALDTSRPIVAVSHDMHNALHNEHDPGIAHHIGPISVPGTELQNRLQQAAKNHGYTRDLEFKNTGHSDITLLSFGGRTLHMIEVDSIMGPLQRGHDGAGNRAGFWMNRRTGPLPEWTPLSPDAQRLLLTGWFLNRVIGRTWADRGEWDGHVGGRVRLHFVDGDTHHLMDEFVSRSYSPNDQVALLLEQVPFAMLRAYSEKTLDALKPYQTLIGQAVMARQGASPLHRWIAKGGPLPEGARLSRSYGGSEERKDAVQAEIARLKKQYQSNADAVGKTEVSAPLSVEVHRQITAALDALAEHVSQISLDSGSLY